MKKMYILYTWHDFKQSEHKLNGSLDEQLLCLGAYGSFFVKNKAEGKAIIF